MSAKRDIVISALVSAAITIAVIGSMIVIHEIESGFKAFLNSVTGHHWVTKSVYTAVLFPVLAALFYFISGSERVKKYLRFNDYRLWTIVLIVVTAVSILASLWVYLHHNFTA